MFMGLFPQFPEKGVSNIDIPALKNALSSGCTLVDVRTDEEWHGGHISGAVHIPLHEIAGKVNELRAAVRLIFICESGNRSGRAAGMLAESGHPAVENVLGGMRAWRAAGGEVVSD